MKYIGKNIRLLRQNQGWSQGQLADKIKISIPALSKIETGVTDINLTRLFQVAEIFGIDVMQILAAPGTSLYKSCQDDLDRLNKTLLEKEQEISWLQKKMIELFDELRSTNSR